jgi:hypothetical protein
MRKGNNARCEEIPFDMDCPGCVIDDNCWKIHQEHCYKWLCKYLAGQRLQGVGGPLERVPARVGTTLANLS